MGTNRQCSAVVLPGKWQFKDDLSWMKGRHNLRMGVDYLWEPKLGGFFEFNPTPETDFLADPSAILADKVKYPQGLSTPGLVGGIAATSGNPDFGLSSKMFGVYFQDDWKINRRLTLNLGIRWDKDFNLIGGVAQGQSRTYQQLKAINSPYAGGLPQDHNKDFSPRVGFAWDVAGNGKHIVRGGYGLYYGQVFINIPLFMLQQVNATLFGTVPELDQFRSDRRQR